MREQIHSTILYNNMKKKWSILLFQMTLEYFMFNNSFNSWNTGWKNFRHSVVYMWFYNFSMFYTCFDVSTVKNSILLLNRFDWDSFIELYWMLNMDKSNKEQWLVNSQHTYTCLFLRKSTEAIKTVAKGNFNIVTL